MTENAEKLCRHCWHELPPANKAELYVSRRNVCCWCGAESIGFKRDAVRRDEHGEHEPGGG